MAEDNNDDSGWDYFKRGAKIGLLGFFGWLIWRLIVFPIRTLYRVRKWLRTERDYIHDFSIAGIPPLFFKYDVYLSESKNPKMEVNYDITRSPVRVMADYEFDIEGLANLVGRADEDPAPQPYDEMNTIKQLIETVLASTPGIHNYVDEDGEYCDFEEARRLKIEYRIYPDGLSQHELMNGIINIVSTLAYVERILSAYQDRLEEQT